MLASSAATSAHGAHATPSSSAATPDRTAHATPSIPRLTPLMALPRLTDGALRTVTLPLVAWAMPAAECPIQAALPTLTGALPEEDGR